MVTKDKQWWSFECLRLSTNYNGYNSSKYSYKLQIPYYHPLNQWLLGATNGNQGQIGWRCYPIKTLHPSVHPSAHLCAPPHTSAHLHAPLRSPLHTPPRTSVHPHAPLCAHLRAPLRTPPCTSTHDSDWLIVPTTTNHIPTFKNLINIKSWFFPHHLFEKPPRTPLHTPTRTSAPLCAPPCISAHLRAPLRAPPRTPPCTSVHLRAPLCTPPRTSVHDSDWLIVPTTTNHIPAFKNLINIKSWFFSPPPLWKTSAPLRAPLRTPPRTSTHLRAPPRTPPCTSMHDSDWLIVPTTTNHIPAFKNLINIKSWFFPHHLFEKPPSSQNRSISWL